MLWERLKHFLVEVCGQKQVLGTQTQAAVVAAALNNPFEGSMEDITLLLPPYEVFETAVHRLIHVGVFQKLHSKYANVIPRSMSFAFVRQVESSVIIAALKDTAFAKFV